MALNWDFFLNTGLMNLKPLEKRLAPIAQNKINIDAEIAYASSISGQIHWQSIKKGSLAGSHTESLMRAVTIWGLISMRSGFFDAGCMNLAPVTRTIASRRDLERVYVILGRSPYRASSWRPSRGLFGFASALYRAVDLMMHSILMQDLYAVRKIPFWEKQIYVVYPEVELGSPLDFKSCRAWTEVTPVIKAWN